MALEKQGLIKHGAPFQYSGRVVYKIELTEKGEPFRIAASDSGDVKGCEQTFVKVTGIAPMESGFARVEYEWTYGNQTPFHALIVRGPGYLQAERPCIAQIGKLYRSSIMFRLYDDGWRIE